MARFTSATAYSPVPTGYYYVGQDGNGFYVYDTDQLASPLASIGPTKPAGDSPFHVVIPAPVVADVPGTQQPVVAPTVEPNTTPVTPQTVAPVPTVEPPAIPQPVPQGISYVPCSLPPYPVDQVVGGGNTTNITNNYYTQSPIASQCEECHSEVLEILGTIADKLTQWIDSQLAESSAIINQCEGLIIGTCDNCCEDAAKLIGKCCNKVRVTCDRMLAEAYQNMALVGIPYPTQEQVLYALESGDYFGSVGYTPNTGQVVPIADCQQTPYGIVCTPVDPCNDLGIDAHNQAVDFINSVSGGTVNEVLDQSTTTINAPITETFTTSPLGTPDNPISVEITAGKKGDLPDWLKLLGPLGPIASNVPDLTKLLVHPTDPQSGTSIGPALDWLRSVGSWCGVDSCRKALENLQAMPSLEGAFRFASDGKGYEVPAWIGPLWFGLNSWQRAIVYPPLKLAGDLLSGTVKVLASLRGCDPAGMSGAIALRLVTGLISRITGGALDDFFKGLTYTVNAACPTEIPSSSEADEAYLNGVITKDQWECWVTANNKCPIPAATVLEGKRTRTQELDLLTLMRWGQVSPEYFSAKMRSLGWTQPDEIGEFIKAHEALPPVSDLIRYMIRDVGDPEIVKKYNLYDQFDVKWSGKLKEWGDAQGMTDEFSKAAWAAHWDYPSPTQAFEMLHRLRPDSVAAQRLNAQSLDKDGPGVITTLDDVTQLLEVNDLAWFWRDRLAAISYRPMTRLDARHAYDADAMTDDEMLSSYQDIGYSLDDAKKLLSFDQIRKAKAGSKPTNSALLSQIKKAYVTGYMTADDMTREVRALYADPNAANKEIHALKTEHDLAWKKGQVACLKKQYSGGVITLPQAINSLTELIGDRDAAVKTAQGLWCSQVKRSRELTVSQLCQMLEKNIIDSGEMLRRVTNLGWSLIDAQRIVANCNADITSKATKAILKQIKEDQLAAEKAAKAQAAAAKQAQKNAAKAAKAAQGNHRGKAGTTPANNVPGITGSGPVA